MPFPTESRTDYRAQANRSFEHESRLKDLLARQAQLNAALDLDKNETQVVPPAEDDMGLAGDILQGPPILRKRLRMTALYRFFGERRVSITCRDGHFGRVIER
jgi:hypothetical protein